MKKIIVLLVLSISTVLTTSAQVVNLVQRANGDYGICINNFDDCEQTYFALGNARGAKTILHSLNRLISPWNDGIVRESGSYEFEVVCNDAGEMIIVSSRRWGEVAYLTKEFLKDSIDKLY